MKSYSITFIIIIIIIITQCKDIVSDEWIFKHEKIVVTSVTNNQQQKKKINNIKIKQDFQIIIYKFWFSCCCVHLKSALWLRIFFFFRLNIGIAFNKSFVLSNSLVECSHFFFYFIFIVDRISIWWKARRNI